MKIINLKDFYASHYAHDCFYEVPDEVAEALTLFKRREQSQIRRKYKNKAHYSLDRDDGIENEALFFELSAQEVYERKVGRMALYLAMQSLTDKQLRRLYACFFLDMSYARKHCLSMLMKALCASPSMGLWGRLSKIINFFD